MPPRGSVPYNTAVVVEPGAVFADRWEVLEPLAQGSTSEVFRGRDRRTGEAAAIKVLRPEYAVDGQALQRFRREARVAQKLSHPHIVAVRDFGIDASHPWIAMELLEGETLEVRLQRAPVPVGDVLDVVDEVAAAVDHAHAFGVVHRDLKPDNVFLLAGDGRPRVKVLDFGFAKILSALEGDGLSTASNAMLGTPLYMSPEQVRSSATVDPRADLWSLGVMVYELLVGDAPFQARSTADLLVEILTRPVPPPSERRPGLPRSLDRWAARALERDPDRRYETAAELARALRAAMDPARAHESAAVTAPHAAAQSRPRPARVAPWLAVVAGVVAALVAAWLLALRP